MSNKRKLRSAAWVVGSDPTAPKQHIDGDRARQFPAEKAGEHLWIVTAAYRVSDQLAAAMEEGSDNQLHMDRESLLTIQGPGCMWCEQPWTRAIAARPCVGDVSR